MRDISGLRKDRSKQSLGYFEGRSFSLNPQANNNVDLSIQSNLNAAQTSLLKPGNLEQLTRKTEINDAEGLLNDFYLKNRNAKYQGPKIDLIPKQPIKFKNPTIRLASKSNIESLTMIP